MNTSLFRNLGAALQHLRQERSWQGEDLAQRARLEPAQLAAIEKGSELPDINSLNRLMGALEIDIDQLRHYLQWCNDAEELSRLGRVASGLEGAATALDKPMIQLLLQQLALSQQVIRLHRRNPAREALQEALQERLSSHLQSSPDGSAASSPREVEA